MRCRLSVGATELNVEVVNQGHLPAGFNLSQVPSGISGLGLVRALLPRKGAAISLEQDASGIVARLRLEPPAVTVLEPL